MVIKPDCSRQLQTSVILLMKMQQNRHSEVKPKCQNLESRKFIAGPSKEIMWLMLKEAGFTVASEE